MGTGSKLINHSSIYLIGSILQRCIGFVMLPIYTRFLSPADYGTIELLTLAIDFVGLIFGLRIAQSIFKYYFEYTGKDRDEVITTALYLVALFSAIGVSLVCLLSPQVSTLTFGDESQARNLTLFSLTLLGQGLVSVPMTSIKAAQKPILFITISLVKVLIQLSLNIYFVVILEMKVEGVIYSSIISVMIMSLGLCIYVFSVRGFRFSLNKSRQLATFSFPLLLSDALSFYLTFGDRYFLRVFHGMAEVGIYSLGYKFGILLPFVVATPFAGIWNTEKYKIAKSENPGRMYAQVFVMFNLALVFVSVGLALFVKDVIRVMAPVEYHSAHFIVPIILAAYIVQAWTQYTNLGMYLKNRTVEYFYSTLIAVVVISLGYYFLIPLYSGIGAAVATLLAYLARFFWIYIRSKKLYDMEIRWREVFMLSSLFFCFVVLGLLSSGDIFVSVSYSFTLMVVFVAVLVFSPVLSRETKAIVKDKLLVLLGKGKGVFCA